MTKMITTTLFIILFSLKAFCPSENVLYIEQVKKIRYYEQMDLFIAHLATKESNNRWDVINQIGCMGKWQIAPITLRQFGYGHITPQRFRQNPEIFPEELQHQVLLALLKSNEIALKDYFFYCGQTIKGVEITKSGLLAAAHLGGAGGVKQFLLTMGNVNRKDINKTSIKHYLQEFGGYEL